MSLPAPTFFVRGDDGEDYGPVDLEELREWVRENRAGLGTTVRLDEPGALWQPWQYHPELVALVAEVRATGTVPGQVGPVLGSLIRRVGAFAIDLCLIYIPMVIIFVMVLLVGFPEVFIHSMVSSYLGQYVTPQIPPPYDSVFNLIGYGGIALYMAGFNWAHGRTPGKSLLRLQVVDQRGELPSASQALVRGLVLSFSVYLLFIPLFYIFFNPQRRALHDLVAGTYVVEN